MPTDMEIESVQSQIVTTNDIRSKVYVIRGQQVMLDSDLAEVYGYEVKRLNEQVKRNASRFPDDFMFQLTADEFENLKSQIATSTWGGRRKLPYVFTEQGVYMLATVLKGELAEQQSVFIMRAFREMRKYIRHNQQLATPTEMQTLTHHVRLLSDKQRDTDARLDAMQQSIDALAQNFADNKSVKEWLFLQGQKFEADVAYIQIYSQAKSTIHIIDDYVNIKTLQLLAKKQDGVAVTIFTDNKCRASERLQQAEIDDFNAEYPSLCVKPNPGYHDRFIVLDCNTTDEIIYMCGSSSKDAGAKVCTISMIETEHIKDCIRQTICDVTT